MDVAKLVPGLTAAAGAAILILWLSGPDAGTVAARVPDVSTTIARPAGDQRPIRLSGKLVLGDGVPADLPGAWPRFRGANVDNIAGGQPALARAWPAAGPPGLWSIDLGEGYAGAAVLDGRVYVLDYDESAKADALRCLSLADGREIWRYSYPVAIKRNHGMSRTVPAVTEKYVVSLGPKCHLVCLDSKTGEFRWAYDLVKQFGTEVPDWYAGQCPLIDDGRVIVAPGADPLMMAIDCATNQIVWRTPNPDPERLKMTHSSIVPMEFAGRKMYVYAGRTAVVGVAADDGSLLWQVPWDVKIATAPSPVVLGGGRIFLTRGYNFGCLVLQLKEQDGGIVAEKAFDRGPEVFGTDQQTPILYGDHLYGVNQDGRLVCLSLDGKQVWSDGSPRRFGRGPYLIANGLIYLMDDFGTLTLAEASASGYRQFAQAKVLHGHDAWGPMALAGGRLIARDLTRMVCLDVREKP